MRDCDVYLVAAKRIASGRETFSCNAIDRIVGGNYSYQRLQYDTVMKGWRSELDVHDINEHARQVTQDNASFFQAARDFRVMLLCMMAACCEDVK